MGHISKDMLVDLDDYPECAASSLSPTNSCPQPPRPAPLRSAGPPVRRTRSR